MLTTPEEVEKTLLNVAQNTDDVDWQIRVESGRNLYTKLMERDEIVITSIVADETLKDDFLIFLSTHKNNDFNDVAITYNELMSFAREKLEVRKAHILKDFFEQLKGDR